MNFLKKILVVIIITTPLISVSQTRQSLISAVANEEPNWVKKSFKKMTRRQRIAQLFMVRVYSNKGQAFEDSIANVIKKQHIGGLVFFQGGPARQAALINRYQQLSKTPLWIAMDGEWGLGMRLDSTISFPYQLTLGAIQDNELIYQMGKQIAQDFKRLGMHINFAPDIDINNNPKNPVIGYRSFGDNKYNVAAKATAYMKGLQDEGILITLKHFPGHGDTDVDSHLDLPQLNFDRKRLDSLELYPFRELIKQGASGVMVAHMHIPAMDTTTNLPATLSKSIVTDVLKNELGFKGLVFSDAMEMKGVVKFFPDEEADVRAVIAGNDVIELSQNTKHAIKLIRKAIRRDRLSWDQVNTSVKKILTAKYWLALDRLQPIVTNNLIEDLNQASAFALNQRLSDAAVTILNGDGLIKTLNFTKKTAVFSLGVQDTTVFQAVLKSSFKNATNFILSSNPSAIEIESLKNQLKNFEQVIVSIHDTRKRPGRLLPYNNELKQFIVDLAKMNVIISIFANPYTLLDLPGIEQGKSIVINYQHSDFMQKAATNVISKQMQAVGKLPVTINSFFKYGDGM